MTTTKTNRSHPTRTFYTARSLFLRLMGGIYFLAFLSLAYQVKGLWGAQGILPAVEYLDLVRQNYDHGLFWKHPTIFWLNAGDGFLQAVTWAGMIFSVLLILGLAPMIVTCLLWFLYLSFIYIGQVFLGYQWDTLLVEVGFLCVFLSPWRWSLRRARHDPPPRLIILLLHLVLFKVMFQSGLVKLMSQDETWANLTALTYHYWTQPIPNPVSWYVHHSPLWFHKLSCLMMFVFELVAPCWIFMGRWMRRAAVIPLVGLQILIMLTGNYGYFNLLVIVLCVLLVDDEAVARLRRRPVSAEEDGPQDSSGWGDVTAKVKYVLSFSLALIIIWVNATVGIRMSFGREAVPGFMRPVAQLFSPWLFANSYGLFAVMTTTRPEIIIEGSLDGKTWRPYIFRYKPGPLDRPPPQVAPHQPRIDWQMWFAALRGNPRHSPWLLRMLEGLAEARPSVLQLLGDNPFKEGPPKYFRAKFYDYEFTTPQQRNETGQWWKRRYRGMYLPEMKWRGSLP